VPDNDRSVKEKLEARIDYEVKRRLLDLVVNGKRLADWPDERWSLRELLAALDGQGPGPDRG
jgi:hypothetical protein